MSAPRLRLYHYWRSSSSWRVRWALELKKVECELVAVSLLDDATDRPEHRSRNPMGFVPVLEFLNAPEASTPALRAKHFLTESVAIIEWLDETLAGPRLLPQDAMTRAHVRRLVEIVNSGIQPLHNPPVYASARHDEDERKKWNQRWIRQGLAAYAEWISGSSGMFSVGDTLTAADLFLIPQCYSALRFEVELEKEFPTLASIYAEALKTPECAASHPDRYQPKA